MAPARRVLPGTPVNARFQRGKNRGGHRGRKRCGNVGHVGWAVKRRLDRGPVPGDDGPFAQLKEGGIRQDHAVVHRLDIRKTAHSRPHRFLRHHVCEVDVKQLPSLDLRRFKRGNGARLTHSLPFEPYDEGTARVGGRASTRTPRTTIGVSVLGCFSCALRAPLFETRW